MYIRKRKTGRSNGLPVLENCQLWSTIVLLQRIVRLGTMVIFTVNCKFGLR